jgi:hypothetical protein
MSVNNKLKFDIFWHQLVILMMSLYLLADMAAGFTVIYLGVDFKISLLYKLPILGILLFLLSKIDIKALLLITGAVLFFFIGPLYQFSQFGRLDFFIFDFASLLKVITPVIVLLYFRAILIADSRFASYAIERIILSGFFILSFNFILGALGFGKSTYKLVDDEGAGSTGLILAGNELGGAFLVTFGFALHKIWNERGLLLYLMTSFFTITCGVIVATKTTMLASLLLVFFIPIANERQRLYSPTKLKAIVFIPLVTIFSVIAYLIVDILERIGLYDRIMWFYKQKGLSGILLSGRDDMAVQRADAVFNHSSLFEQVFGQGQAFGLKDKHGLSGVEIDSIDIFNFFGIFTLTFVCCFYLWVLYCAHLKTLKGQSDIAPFVFVVSFILLFLSQLSGHIWNSGTVGILMGVMAAGIFKPTYNNFKAKT